MGCAFGTMLDAIVIGVIEYSKFELSRYNMAAQDPSHGDEYFEGSCRVFSVKETDKFVFLALQVLYIAHPISMNGLQY